MANVKEHQAVLLELITEFDRVCRKLDIRYILFAGSMLGAVRHQGFIPWDDDLDVLMMREDYEKFMRLAPAEIGADYYVQESLSEHWQLPFSKLRKNNTTCIEKYHPKDKQTHQGIYMDIFPCDNASDNEFVRRLQYYVSRIVVAKCLYVRGYETNSLLKKVFMRFSMLFSRKMLCRFVQRKGKNKSKTVHTFFAATSKYSKGILQRKWVEEIEYRQFENLTVPISAHYDEILSTLYGDYMQIPPEEDRKCKVHAILIDTEKNYTEYLDYVDGMEFTEYTRSIR